MHALPNFGFETECVWHEDPLLEETTGIMLPGGFSYDNYLRGGAMAVHSSIMGSAREATDDGTSVFGAYNGA